MWYLVSDGAENGTVVTQLGAGGLQGLVQGTGHGSVIADGFAGGLHFGGQVGIQTADLVEGEDGSLHVEAFLLVGI